MAAPPHPPTVSVEEYLTTSYPDGDREYIDGNIVERNLGAPAHSTLLKILTIHLGAFEKPLRIAVRPECRTRVEETKYRVPDVLLMLRPFRQTDRVVLEAPFLIVEILSLDDRMRDTIQRFRDYEKLGVPQIILMDSEDRSTFVFATGDLVRRDLDGFEIPGHGFLAFPSAELLARLDEE